MKLLDQWFELLEDNEKPNKFTIGMGVLIRKAREELNFSQRDLASKIHRRQAALSDMENGLMKPDAETLLSLSYELQKPISYFYPSPYKPDPQLDELSEKEKEFLIQVKNLDEDNFNRIIAFVKVLIETN